MIRLPAALRCVLALAAALAAGAPAAMAEADPSLAALDRLIARSLEAAGAGTPDEARAVAVEREAWLGERPRVLDGGDVMPRIAMAASRLRAIMAASPQATRAAVLAAARPIDPLQANDPAAEEGAAFVAYALTTLHPQPPRPQEDEYLSGYERYAGFTFAAALPDGRLLVAVPEECGAFQCVTVPFLLDRGAGVVERAAVEGLASDTPTVQADGLLTGALAVSDEGAEVTELARADGGCGSRWTYRAEGAVLRLVKRTVKTACDGKPWTPQSTVTRAYR